MDLSIADPKQFLEVKEFIWKSKLLFGNPKLFLQQIIKPENNHSLLKIACTLPRGINIKTKTIIIASGFKIIQSMKITYIP